MSNPSPVPTEFTHQGVTFVNFAGEPAEKPLRILAEALDLPRLSDWEAVGADGHGGNCFYTTTQAMADLISAGDADRFVLATGIFEHVDVPHVTHAWIEYRRPSEPALVVNVSNIPARPLYMIDRREYRRINRCKGNLQTLTARAFVTQAARFLNANRETASASMHQLDIRAFTKHLLDRTLLTVPSGADR